MSKIKHTLLIGKTVDGTDNPGPPNWMRLNIYIVALLSIFSATLTISLWAIALGAMLDISILYSSELIGALNNILIESSGLASMEILSRFFIGVLAFFLPGFVLSFFGFLKAILLPRNVNLQTAWDMEMKRAYRNAWLLFANLKGNFQ